MHERGFARAIVAHQSQAFATAHLKAYPAQRADGAEISFNAVQFYCRVIQGLVASNNFGCIFSCVLDIGYATFFRGREVSFEIGLVDLQEWNGHVLLILLPSRIIWATQKASVETPGAMETDMVS